MADNVTYTAAADATPPSGTKAATDELSDGSHAGIAKLAISANGDRTLVPATAADGLLVQVSNPTAGTGLTDAELRATPVPVSGTVSVTEPVSVDDNGGSLTVDNAALSVVGGGTEAAAQRVTIANDSTGLLSVDDNGGSLTVDGTVDIGALPNEGQQTMANSISVAVASDQSAIPISGTVTTGGLTDTQLRATPVPVSGTVTANAGTNLNTSLLALEAGGNLAAAAASLSVMDDWDESDRAKVNPIVGQAGVAAGTGTDGATVQRVSLATNVPLPAGTNAIGKLSANSGVDIGDVTVDNAAGAAAVNIQDGGNSITVDGTVTANQGTAGTAWEVVGDVAADIAVPANPLSVGGRASTALPTAVSADGDSVYQWLLRSGALMTAQLPHLGMLGDPYTLDSETAQYTTTQTSTILSAVGTGSTMAVTSIQIQAAATTAGTMQVYFGDGSYNRGNSLAIFDGEFAPSATLKPGFAMAPFKPWIGPVNQDLRVTTNANMTVTVTVWFYLI